MVAEKLEEVIEKAVKNKLSNYNNVSAMGNNEPAMPKLVEFVETDSLGETLEKLAILHIRTWMLEDAIQAARTDKQIADLKRKIDICFKVKRPKYVAAINAMIDNSIKTGRSLHEDSVKFYKGIDNE